MLDVSRWGDKNSVFFIGGLQGATLDDIRVVCLRLPATHILATTPPSYEGGVTKDLEQAGFKRFAYGPRSVSLEEDGLYIQLWLREQTPRVERFVNTCINDDATLAKELGYFTAYEYESFCCGMSGYDGDDHNEVLWDANRGSEGKWPKLCLSRQRFVGGKACRGLRFKAFTANGNSWYLVGRTGPVPPGAAPQK